MNKKELAEQIAEKHLGKVSWKLYGERQKQQILAAIVEAMDTKPEESDRELKAITALQQEAQINESKQKLDDYYNSKQSVEAMGVQPDNKIFTKEDARVLLNNFQEYAQAHEIDPPYSFSTLVNKWIDDYTLLNRPNQEAMGEKPEAEIEDKYKIDPELEKITGWRTGAEWMAFDKGYNTYDSIVIEQIEKWDGKATNSGLYDALKKKFEAMGVQPGMSEADNISIAADAYIDKFWYEQDRKTKRLMHMAYRAGAMSMLNNEQEVKVSDTTDDAQRYVADNQEAIAKCDNPPCSNVKFNTLAGFNLCTCGWSEAIEPKGE